MMNVDLQQLIQTLTTRARRDLERSAERCVTRGGREVLVEDLLLTLLEHHDGLMVRALADAGIEAGELQAALQPRGEASASRNPVFAQALVQWLQQALMVAHLELRQTEVDHGALLLALLRHPLHHAGSTYQVLLSRLDAQRVHDFVLSQSPETNPVPNGESLLERFTHDLTRQAHDGRIDPVLCRDAEIGQLIDILMRRRKNNPILVGEAGVGKTAVVEGLALRVASAQVPKPLQDVRVLTLDMGLLQAGASIKGEFERRLKGVIDEVNASPKPVILFIDEAHTLVGVGAQAGASDAANLLKPALARGELRTIAATTWSEYKKYFEKDPALARRFQPVLVSEPSVEQAVSILRGLVPVYEHTRLHEIQQTLHVDVPVYLVLTQADRLAGFAEFFDARQGDGTEDVLGARLVAGTSGTDVAQVREVFENLLQGLGAELIPRLHQERSIERRGRMLDFPRQVARIGDRMCLFIETAFCAHRYQRINGMRGFYLTCAKADDVRPHFVQGLFNRVIFAEADLAGLHTPERRRIRRRHGLLALAATLVIGAAGAVWTHSYAFNHQRLEQLRGLINTQPSPDADESVALLALLDSRLAATKVFPPLADARWVDRAGLYQGEVSRAPLVSAYEEALHQQLLPYVIALLEGQVRGRLGDRERLLDSLRAYLMLNLRERRDTAWLGEYVAGQWAAHASTHKGLNEHVARLLEQPFLAPLNDELVAQARLVLRGESLAEVVYRTLREQARSLEPYRLAEGSAFSRVEPPIPGFYSKKYLQFFETQGPRLVNAIAQDNWVLGEGADLSAMDLRRLMLALEQRYFSEYADAWSDALGRVRLLESGNLRQDARQLASLTSAQSALVQLLQQVRENTRLVPITDQFEAVGQPIGELGAVTSRVLSRAALPDSARRALQRRFEPLHQLLDEEQNPGGELTPALRLLDELHLQLSTLNRDSSPEQAAFKMARQRMDGQQPLLGNLRDAAGRLPQPLNGWFEGMADQSWRHLLDDAYGYVNQRYQSEVHGFYAKAIQRRYPFEAHAGSDVALGDFQAFFKPRGTLARFYEGYLRAFVSVEGNRYRLRALEGRSLPMSRLLLDQLTRAQTIRQGFFTEEQGDWAVRFTLAPYSLDQAVSRALLRVGDQQLEYRHGPIVPMAFHWPSEADNGRSSLVLERGAERPLGIEKDRGAWSLFRLFDLMQSEPASSRAAQILKADLAGLRANYVLTSQRSPSPFQMAAWRTFRLPEQL